MISFDAVTKALGFGLHRRVVLNDVSLELPPAKIAVLGGRGSERSLVLRLISGTALPTHGKVRRTVTVSWPFGSSRIFSQMMSGAENIRFLARVYGRDVHATTGHVEELAELGKVYDEPVGDYSPDERIRLAFGASLAFDFDLYIFEELNRMRALRARGLMADAFEERLTGTRIIVTSQRLDDLRTHCDVAVVLRDARLHIFDDVDEAIAQSGATNHG